MLKSGLIRMEWGRQLLALERERGGDADGWAEAAARVHEQVVPRVATLLGLAGVQALLRRSARVAAGAFPCLSEPAMAESATALATCLRAQQPELALDAAANLFSMFFALLETFIGRRLTVQLIRGCWPDVQLAGAPGQSEGLP